MSTLTDPTSTPPGERIDTDEILKRLTGARLEATFAARQYFASKDKGLTGDLMEYDERHAREKLAAEAEIWAEFLAAVDHNERRRLTARQGIAEARQALTDSVARSNGYQTRAEADEARGEDRHHRDLDGVA